MDFTAYLVETLYSRALDLFIASIAIALLSSAISAPLRRGGAYPALASSALISLALGSLSIAVLIRGIPLRLSIEIPRLGVYPPIKMYLISIEIDTLSAFFVLLLSIVTFTASIYGFGYTRRFLGREHLGWYGLNYVLFILSMYMALAVNDLFWFIVFWELMTLFSQFLVSFEKEKRAAVWAGYKYFCITKFGAILLIVTSSISMVILARSTSYRDIATCLASLASTNPIAFYILIACFTVGLLVKCAAIPFHSWLPDAHPEAPSNVSALLSGAMIKVPIYMLVRVLFQFAKADLYLGIAIATIGTATLAIGTLFALMQRDSKRLLAYHSVGQIGYILLGLGVAVVLLRIDVLLAGLAFIGSLYHAMNHAIFKSLLFLTAGTAIYATGSRDLDVLGGLAKYMPTTALCALIASLSIAGVPPFNGFVSKWLIYLSTISTNTVLSIYGVIAIFISSVTAASFVKYFTTIFTRAPRISLGKVPRIPISMNFSQVLLAILCIALGIYPYAMVKTVSSIASSLGIAIPMDRVYVAPSYIGVDTLGAIPLMFIAVVICLAIPIAIALSREEGIAVWSCGMSIPRQTLSMPGREYYAVFERVFHEVYTFSEAMYRAFVVRLGRAFVEAFESLRDALEDPCTAIPIAVTIATIISIVTIWVRLW